MDLITIEKWISFPKYDAKTHLPINEIIGDMEIHINDLNNRYNNGCIMAFNLLKEYNKGHIEHTNEMLDLFNYWKEIVYPINKHIFFSDYLDEMINIIPNNEEFKPTSIAVKIYKGLWNKIFEQFIDSFKNDENEEEY